MVLGMATHKLAAFVRTGRKIVAIGRNYRCGIMVPV